MGHYYLIGESRENLIMNNIMIKEKGTEDFKKSFKNFWEYFPGLKNNPHIMYMYTYTNADGLTFDYFKHSLSRRDFKVEV